MPSEYVRFILFKGGRFFALGAAADSVAYYDFDQQAEATAAGIAWLGAASVSNPWYAVFGQQENGRLVRVAGEDT